MLDILKQLKQMPEYDELRWAAILEIEVGRTEIARLTEEVKRLRAVVDAALDYHESSIDPLDGTEVENAWRHFSEAVDKYCYPDNING